MFNGKFIVHSDVTAGSRAVKDVSLYGCLFCVETGLTLLP